MGLEDHELRSERGMTNREVVTSSSREGWTTGLLLAVMLMAVTTSVASANWADGVWLTPYAALGGLLFGGLVTRLRLPAWLAHPLMLLEGAFASALLASTLVQPPWATWNERMVMLETRLAKWFSAVTGGGTGTDALLFVMLLCILAWFIGYLSAWSVFRLHEPWGAILPSGAALLINLFYSLPQSGLFLMVFLLSAMLLLVRTTLLRREAGWRRMSIRFANDIGYDFLTYGVVFSGIIILASWLVPPSAPGPQWASGITDRVRGPWQDFGENMARMFSTVRNVDSGGPTTLFSSSLSLGGPIHLGVRPVLNITASTGRYWGAVSFDRYTGSGWVNSAPVSDSFSPNDPRMMPPPVTRSRVVTQTVQVLLPGDNYVIAATEPMRVSDSTDARFALASYQGESYQDIASLRIQRVLHSGDTYTVVSETSGADEASLRAAAPSYPQYIRERYLSLPSSMPSRVHDLALRITAQATNNYDRARAIESYLRTNIKYDESVAPPPPDVDAVDYTLFDRPAGYCNYYASSMAVLAREIGIPSRVVSGYAMGDQTLGVFHVIEGNAHTWPELYFGDLGWIQFEPTSSKPEIIRPLRGPAVINPSDSSASTLPSDVPRRGGQNLGEGALGNQSGPNFFLVHLPSGPAGIAAGAGTGGVLFLIAAIIVAQLLWAHRMRLLSPAGRAWEEMYRFAHWTGFREKLQATPAERAEALARLLPDARSTIENVAEMYVREKYGKQALSPEELMRAERARAVLAKRVLRGAIGNILGERPRQLGATAMKWFEQMKRRSSSGEKLNG
jgi:transglutaminase-like putative cysteine protease